MNFAEIIIDISTDRDKIAVMLLKHGGINVNMADKDVGFVISIFSQWE